MADFPTSEPVQVGTLPLGHSAAALVRPRMFAVAGWVYAAFSGDSIPTHLLSVEALTDDLRVLKPAGLLASTFRTGITTSPRPWSPACNSWA